jgi:2-haloacid dehalogenase
MTLSRDSFDLLSFDCYGTLVDWEAGIWRAVQALGFQQGQFEPSRGDVMVAFSQAEAEFEQESNAGDFVPYRTILERVFERLAHLWGWRVSAADCRQFAESIKDWPVFEDTVASLQAFAKDFPLHILSNIDADLFAFTQEKLGVQFAGVLTADVVRSYKPAPGHFEMLLKQTGVPAERILHIAQSRFHDIAPAKALGFKTIWLDRQGGISLRTKV